jgi:hypothetical protein
MAMMHFPRFRNQQVFNRRSAVKLHRILAAKHGIVNLDASFWQMSCDGSPVPKPRYITPGAMLCRNPPTGDHNPRSSRARTPLELEGKVGVASPLKASETATISAPSGITSKSCCPLRPTPVKPILIVSLAPGRRGLARTWEGIIVGIAKAATLVRKRRRVGMGLPPGFSLHGIIAGGGVQGDSVSRPKTKRSSAGSLRAEVVLEGATFFFPVIPVGLLLSVTMLYNGRSPLDEPGGCYCD